MKFSVRVNYDTKKDLVRAL